MAVMLNPLLEGSLVDWRGELLLDNGSCIHIYLRKAAIKNAACISVSIWSHVVIPID